MGAPTLRIAMTNEPENVALIREALSGFVEPIEVERSQLDDIKTAVSEAANNVVLHAYDGDRGPLKLDAQMTDGWLEIVVRDEGHGIRPRRPTDEPVQGVGLSVIQALTDRVEFGGNAGEGTEVRMRFRLQATTAEAGISASEIVPLDGDTPPWNLVVSVRPARYAATVLGRIAALLAARARFSIDRLSDAQLVTDSVAAETVDGQVTVAFDVAPQRLDLRVGPLAQDAVRRLAEGAEVTGTVLTKLADEVDPQGDLLRVSLRDRRA